MPSHWYSMIMLPIGTHVSGMSMCIGIGTKAEECNTDILLCTYLISLYVVMCTTHLSRIFTPCLSKQNTLLCNQNYTDQLGKYGPMLCCNW